MSKENGKPGALFDDDVRSMTSSEMERQVEEELARMVQQAGDEEVQDARPLSFDQDDEDSDGDGPAYQRNPAFDQSHTSFKSAKSDATVLT
jgi:hypothetical protein